MEEIDILKLFLIPDVIDDIIEHVNPLVVFRIVIWKRVKHTIKSDILT